MSYFSKKPLLILVSVIAAVHGAEVHQAVHSKTMALLRERKEYASQDPIPSNNIEYTLSLKDDDAIEGACEGNFADVNRVCCEDTVQRFDQKKQSCQFMWEKWANLENNDGITIPEFYNSFMAPMFKKNPAISPLYYDDIFRSCYNVVGTSESYGWEGKKIQFSYQVLFKMMDSCESV